MGDNGALRIAPNTHVTLDLSLESADEEPMAMPEGEDGVVEYVHGYGMLVPGLEKALAGMKAGDRREIVVPPDEGYGERDEDMVIEVDRADLPNHQTVEIGDEIVAELPDGDSQTLTVLEVHPDSVVVDGNHPLSGMTLRYAAHVREVRPATEAEIEDAARELSEAQEELEAEERHEAEAAQAEALVTLRRKDQSTLN